MIICVHKHTQFLSTKPEDRLPGMFVCLDCTQKFTSDPNKPGSVNYKEDSQGTKTLPEFKSSGA